MVRSHVLLSSINRRFLEKSLSKNKMTEDRKHEPEIFKMVRRLAKQRTNENNKSYMQNQNEIAEAMGYKNYNELKRVNEKIK